MLGEWSPGDPLTVDTDQTQSARIKGQSWTVHLCLNFIDDEYV